MSLSIGITCYPTFGGSGVLATELGMALARRGHAVHFICAALPKRLDPDIPGVHFHPVVARDYPVFPHVPYSLALCSKMVAVAKDAGLDLLHVHYAVPHATSAWMAREILPSLRVVTTLHGTDITLVGSDASYLPITRHSIEQSDALTTPSAALRDETLARFDLNGDTAIDVIPNFVDTDGLHPLRTDERPALTALFGDADVPVLLHVSNFRPVKRVDRVVEVFRRVAAQRPCRLVMVGDGPTRADAESDVESAGLSGQVRFLGLREHFEDVLREASVFLLPSETESFGLAAVEALASGVPVVASRVGGLSEVIREGETGFLTPEGDVAAMAYRVMGLLEDPEARQRMGEAAAEDARARFRPGPIIDRYEALYRRVLG